jgi:hypothetical protein
MTTEQFRQAVVSRVLAWQLANYPALPVITENGPVPDENTIGPIWLDLELRWYGAQNVTMGVNPLGRHTGAVSANVFYRAYEGAAQPGAIVDSLITLLKNVGLGSGQLQFPQRTVPTTLKGWYKSGILVPFYLNAS